METDSTLSLIFTVVARGSRSEKHASIVQLLQLSQLLSPLLKQAGRSEQKSTDPTAVRVRPINTIQSEAPLCTDPVSLGREKITDGKNTATEISLLCDVLTFANAQIVDLRNWLKPS